MISTIKKLLAILLVFITLLIFPNPAGSLAATNRSAIIFSPPLGYGDSARYGPRITFDNAGTLIETTDYGIQNPDLSHFSPCFNLNMNELLHAGEDWYRMDGQSTEGATVTAVADGTIYDINPGPYPGFAIVIEHTLSSEQSVYSVYMHI